MKKNLLIVLAMILATSVMAQSRQTLIQESFDGSSLPSGWTTAGVGTSNWKVSATQNAGGQPNEIDLGWSPQFNGISRLVTPAVDLTGIESVVFSFKHALDNYSGANTIGIATSSDGGTNWNVGWNHAYSTSGQYEISELITTPDMGSSDVKFCIYFSGNSYNINDWYFDDVVIFTQENLDLGIASSTMPTATGSGAIEMGINVFNYGIETITSIEAAYTTSNGDSDVETFEVNIPSLSGTTLTFTEPIVLLPGDYNIDFTLNMINGNGGDDDPSNNSLKSSISIAIGSVAKTPMIEHFSSSTCGPCVSVNTTMLNFCNNNPGRFTYTKYQMNWPGNGDPYYTEEGGVRRTYYGCNAVPQCFLDGQDQGNAPVSQGVFDQHAALDAFFDIRGAFTVEGNVVNIEADIMPYISTEARVYVSINEKETHNNVGGNGETSFHHVFMKMLPNAQGTTINFTAGESNHLAFSQDMTGTHVEEMSDLEVSIWVQNHATKEVYNSHFAMENAELPYPAQNLNITEDDETGLATTTWEAPAQGNPNGYNVYLNGELVLEGTTDMSYEFEVVNGEYYGVEVFAVYEGGITSVSSFNSLTSTLNVNENSNTLRIFPNPASQNIFVYGTQAAQMMIYNAMGQMVENLNNTNEFNVADYANGVYVLKVIDNNGSALVTRFVVNH